MVGGTRARSDHPPLIPKRTLGTPKFSIWLGEPAKPVKLASRWAYVAQAAEHFLGKEEVPGSNPGVGSSARRESGSIRESLAYRHQLPGWDTPRSQPRGGLLCLDALHQANDAAGLSGRDGGGRRPERDREAAQPAIGPKPLRPILGEGAAAARFQDHLAWRPTPRRALLSQLQDLLCLGDGERQAVPGRARLVCEGCGLVIDREVGVAKTCSSSSSGAEGPVEPRQDLAVLGMWR
jgi:hypothetical protein